MLISVPSVYPSSSGYPKHAFTFGRLMPSSDTVSFDTFLHDYGVLIKCLITNYPSGDFTYFLFV